MAAPKSKSVSQKRTAELLASGAGQSDEELRALTNSEWRRFTDGSALTLLPDGKGRLYASRDAALVYMREVAQMPVEARPCRLRRG